MKKDLKLEKEDGGGYFNIHKGEENKFFIFAVILYIHFSIEVSKFEGHQITFLLMSFKKLFLLSKDF